MVRLRNLHLSDGHPLRNLRLSGSHPLRNLRLSGGHPLRDPRLSSSHSLRDLRHSGSRRSRSQRGGHRLRQRLAVRELVGLRRFLLVPGCLLFRRRFVRQPTVISLRELLGKGTVGLGQKIVDRRIRLLRSICICRAAHIGKYLANAAGEHFLLLRRRLVREKLTRRPGNVRGICQRRRFGKRLIGGSVQLIDRRDRASRLDTVQLLRLTESLLAPPLFLQRSGLRLFLFLLTKLTGLRLFLRLLFFCKPGSLRCFRLHAETVFFLII